MGNSATILQTPQVFGNGVYPFADHATMLSVEGVAMPPFILTDARSYPIGGGPYQYLSTVTLLSDRARVSISDIDIGQVSSGEVVGIGQTQMVMRDAYDRAVGVLVGNFDYLRSIMPAPTTLTFTENALPLAATCVVPQPQGGLHGILDDESHLLTGDVWLVGEDGVVLAVSGNTIKIHLVGDRLFVRRSCENEEGQYTAPRPLKKITVLTEGLDPQDLLPDAYGNITISPGNAGALDNVIRVSAEPYGLRLHILNNFD